MPASLRNGPRAAAAVSGPGARRPASGVRAERLFAAPIGKWQVVSAGGEDTSRRLCAFQLKYLNIELQGWFWRLVAIIPLSRHTFPRPITQLSGRRYPESCV